MYRYHLKHNAEAEAIDLLIEVNLLEKLLDSNEIDEGNYARVGLYVEESLESL